MPSSLTIFINRLGGNFTNTHKLISCFEFPVVSPVQSTLYHSFENVHSSYRSHYFLFPRSTLIWLHIAMMSPLLIMSSLWITSFVILECTLGILPMEVSFIFHMSYHPINTRILTFFDILYIFKPRTLLCVLL